MEWKKSHEKTNDVTFFLKYALIVLLIVLTPITLFLTGFAWYASLEVYISKNIQLSELPLFFKNSLIFGVIGLMSFLLYFAAFFIIDYFLKWVDFQWKKFILIFALLAATGFFLLFEIFSLIFLDFFYTWQMVLILTFWPVVYILLAMLLLVRYFDFQNPKKENLELEQTNEKNLIYQTS